MSKMHVLVGGGTGFIGRHLIKQLNTTGHKVTIVSRGAVPGHAHVTWDDVARGTMPEDITAIVNLAGAQILSIKARTQPEQFKREVRESRIDTARLCAQLCEDRAASGRPIDAFVQGTAVGYYHLTPNEEANEETPGGIEGEMAQLVRAWEEAAQLDENCPTRRVLLRTGVVMGNDGGIIQNTMPSFKMGLGGPISFKGDQILNWIHMDDQVGIIEHVLQNEQLSGPVNAVAPEVQTNRQWAEKFAKALGRPCLMFVPTCAMDAAYGAEIAKLVNEGIVIKSNKLAEYRFKHPTMDDAMAQIVAESPGFLAEVRSLLG